MQFLPPVSPEDLLLLINRNPALAPPISSRSSTGNIPISRAPVEIRLEQEVEEAVDYDAGAMIVRRFSCFSSILSSSKTGRRSLLYAAPMIPQAAWPGVRSYTRPAPLHQSLILGTDAFTTYHSASNRLQNFRWKYIQNRRPAAFALTITSHGRDRDDTEPGVLTSKDILVQRECSFFRIAVGDPLTVTQNWGIFRCFSYPDSDYATPLPEAGLLRVPLTLVSRTRDSRSQRFAPYVDASLEQEWAAIRNHNKHSVFLLFPLGYTSATVTYLIQHPAPLMFSGEIRAHQSKHSAREDGVGPETRALQGRTAANRELSDEETVVDTNSQHRADDETTESGGSEEANRIG